MNKGQYYEEQAARHLRDAGLQILHRNFRCKVGEIDLICREDETLVFVEVRFRGSPGYASAGESITATKQRRLLRTALYYLQRHGGTSRQSSRFDAVLFSPLETSAGASRGARAEDGIQWLKNAITM